MSELECPGLPAFWLNAWLAAVGVTVLVPEMRLSWTDGPAPQAVLATSHGKDPVHALASAWPSPERVAEMPIAEQLPGCDDIAPNLPLRSFRERAARFRGHDDSWSISSTYTDLHVDETQPGVVLAARSRFAPPAPGPVGPIHRRLARVFGLVDEPFAQLAASLEGGARRVSANGLGFDISRVTALADDSDKSVDPVLEVLAFFGLALLPIRGAGTRRTAQSRSAYLAARQRLWFADSDDARRHRLMWPAWSHPLGMNGIDALLDAWSPLNRGTWRRLGVHAGWRSVEYMWQGNDPTRGIGSEAL